MKRIVKFIAFLLCIPIFIVLYVIGSFKFEIFQSCNSLEELSESADAVGRIRQGVAVIAHEKELKANLFLSRQLDLEDFNLMNFDWALFGIDPEEVKFRLNAPRGRYEKTLDKISSVSILINRCCILKIPMKKDAPLQLTDIEKKLQKSLKNKELYLSCEFYLMN